MNQLNKAPSPNQFFYLGICLAVISLLITAVIADQQNDKALANYQKYLQGSSLVKEGKYNEALNILANLDKDFADSYQVFYLKGVSYLQTRQFAKAAFHLEQARKQNPALLMDPTFLYICGEAYYQQHDFDRSRLYWKKCLQFKPGQNLKDKIQHSLRNLRKQGGA
ncbi:MAG: tetratricopeptide repeat protein [Methanobacterium sp.]